MLATFQDWQNEDGFLYISKFGLDANNKVFIEVTTQKATAYRFTKKDMIKGIMSKVDILCVRSGGRYLDQQAKDLLNTYMIES